MRDCVNKILQFKNTHKLKIKTIVKTNTDNDTRLRLIMIRITLILNQTTQNCFC